MQLFAIQLTTYFKVMNKIKFQQYLNNNQFEDKIDEN